MRRFFHHHGLSVTMLGFFLATFLGGQVLTGLRVHNAERTRDGELALSVTDYLRSAHFIEATAENWESEFFQMFVYVVATAFLFQKGSAESKDPDSSRKRSAPKITARSPWPVRRGGWIHRVYRHSLSLAFLLLFLGAFILHVAGGHRLYNEDRARENEPPVLVSEYLGSSRFWFESFQNWQSEFLAIGSMVVLTIFLREAHSPESKEVETPHWENEE